jgi:hypothetical protein
MTDVDSKLAQAAVLLDRQYLMLTRIHERGKPALTTAETAIDAKSTTIEHVLDVYNYVFALIDNLARYQKIAGALPRFNQKEPEFRALAASLGNIKGARNQLQHINNDIENDYSGPLLGGICWINGDRQFLVALHDIGRKRSSPGIVFDNWNNRYLNEFCFTYGDTYYDLAKAMAGVRAFNSYLASAVRIEIDGKPYVADQHFSAISVAFLTQSEVECLQRDQEVSLSAQTSGT